MNIKQAYDYVDAYHPAMEVWEIYDEDPDFRTAMSVLFPNFEYPDFSGLKMCEVLAKYKREAGDV
jgi:hypothetical protein